MAVHTEGEWTAVPFLVYAKLRDQLSGQNRLCMTSPTAVKAETKADPITKKCKEGGQCERQRS